MIRVAQSLRWEHLDPATHPFEPDAARAIAERLVEPLAAARPRRDRVQRAPELDQCEREIDLALVAHYGAWVAGWNWCASEPGCGGPVRGWCCARDSMLREGEEAGATIERVVSAVCDWRAYLEELAQAQRSLTVQASALATGAMVERAAVRYVALVLARTGAEDAWYVTFESALRWHLEAVGFDDARVHDAIAGVVRGAFESWVAPAEEVAASVTAGLGRELAATLNQPPPVVDVLPRWRSLRERMREPAAQLSRTPVRRDGHRTFIDRHDRARCDKRARRMHDALTLVRGRASEPLSWGLLCDAQRLVLGREHLRFRQGEAFAKNGLERYGLDDKTERRFERCLEQASDASKSPVMRAARAYLDVCFYHPFDDGNARAARLALDHVLTGAGLALYSAEPPFLLPRAADDPDGPWALTLVLDVLAGPRVP